MNEGIDEGRKEAMKDSRKKGRNDRRKERRSKISKDEMKEGMKESSIVGKKVKAYLSFFVSQMEDGQIAHIQYEHDGTLLQEQQVWNICNSDTL